MRQSDMKRMLAYSSINHLSYCLLAIFSIYYVSVTPDASSVSAAKSGTLLQIFNHGISAAALFYCVGIFESRSGTRSMNDFGGVRKIAPLFATLCGISLFSSLGLPGLNGFVGEFLIFRGVFGLAPWAAGVALFGLLGTALFLLTFWQKVFHNTAGKHTSEISDLTASEVALLAPLIVLMFLLGIVPQIILNLLN